MLSSVTIAASGSMRTKMARQPKLSMTAPATIGPIAGAQAMTMPDIPMAMPRFSRGNKSIGT